jgi:hypothetical protein
MTANEDDKLQEIVRRELGHRGYVVSVRARKEGDFVVGSVAVTSAETDVTVAKVVGVGNVTDVRLCFGFEAEGTVRELILKALGTVEGVKHLVPSFVIAPPKT